MLITMCTCSGDVVQELSGDVVQELRAWRVLESGVCFRNWYARAWEHACTCQVQGTESEIPAPKSDITLVSNFPELGMDTCTDSFEP